MDRIQNRFPSKAFFFFFFFFFFYFPEQLFSGLNGDFWSDKMRRIGGGGGDEVEWPETRDHPPTATEWRGRGGRGEEGEKGNYADGQIDGQAQAVT